MQVRRKIGVSGRAVVLWMAAASAAGLSGCKVGPNYSKPELGPQVAPPEAFAEQAGVIAPEEHPGLSAWWTELNDPTLTGLIERARTGNHDLRIAVARIRQARAARGVAASAGLPQVGSSAAYSRSRESENTANGGFFRQDASGEDNYRVGLDASWEIDLFGAVARSVEAAEADIQAEQEALNDVRLMLAAEVARNYVDLRGFQRRIAVTMRNQAVQRETLELTESRFNAGLSSELDVTQARAQLEATTAAIPPLEIGVRQAIHRLGVICGTQPGALLAELDAPVTAESVPATVSWPATVPAGLPSDLLRRRPDIRRVERQLAAQTARIGVATSELFPRFSLTGEFGLASAQIGRIADGDSRFWSIGPGMKWPIFAGGRIRSNIAQQEAIAEELLARYEQTVLVSLQDVEDSLVGYTREQRRRESLVRAVDANKRAVELSDQLYRAGLADFQRVLTSQLQLFISEESVAASDQAVLQALVRLYQALGGGWEEAAVPPTAPAGK